jgi:hypothetical protein
MFLNLIKLYYFFDLLFIFQPYFFTRDVHSAIIKAKIVPKAGCHRLNEIKQENSHCLFNSSRFFGGFDYRFGRNQGRCK